MLTDSLKLNDDKSEFLVIGTPQQLAKVNNHCIRVGDCNVSEVSSARNLGSWLDKTVNGYPYHEIVWFLFLLSL